MCGPNAIVSAGFGGLASALRLRARGIEVEVADGAARLSGRAQLFDRRGLQIDAGSTVVTTPFLFDELVAENEQDRCDHLAREGDIALRSEVDGRRHG